ncbi:MAG: DUF3179 domain-containing protein [Phycisphaeraceae bacterium]
MRMKTLLAVSFATVAVGLLMLSIIAKLGEENVTAQPRPTDAGAIAEQFNLDDLRIPRDEIRSGGPSKDAIPAITDPDVARVSEVDFLEPTDRMVAITIEGESRAYPIRLLNWHEAVNDQLGETPFAVTYCPLCDSASVFDRRMNGEVLEFGISGLLYNSNVLLYDRTHDALWSQIGFEAVSGPYAGQPLKHLPFELTTFAQWEADHPDATVATFDTGYARQYSRNPYEHYFQGDTLMFPVKQSDDRRLGEKQPLVGVQIGDVARAYPLEAIASAPDGRIEEAIAGERLVLEISNERDHIRVVELPDEARVIHTFWFAWVAFHPETTIYGQGE